MLQDTKSQIKVLPCISPTRVADDTAQTGSAVDLSGSNGCAFVIAIGTLADANATFAVEIQESDASGSGFTAVADGDLVGTEAGAGFIFSDDDEVRTIGYIGEKRYVKAVITPSGNGGNADLSCVAVLTPKLVPNDSQES